MSIVTSKETELLLKVITGVLGMFFVLGILITNLQLMELGLADFSSLKTRNIMIGFTFLIYLLFVPVIIFPLSAVAAMVAKILFDSSLGIKRKVGKIVFITIIGIFVFGFICMLAGTVIGWMFPWGQPWAWEAKDWSRLDSWLNWDSDFVEAYSQLKDAFYYPKIIASFLCAFLVLIIFSMKNKSFNFYLGVSNYKFGHYSYLFDSEHIRWFYSYLLVFFFGFGLVGYANSVYPNIKYNLGGGQPALIKLIMEKDEVPFEYLLERESNDGEAKKLVATEALALWYKDNKFFYVTPLIDDNQSEHSVVAIDTNTVKAMEYLDGYIRVDSGGHIKASSLVVKTVDTKSGG